MKKSLFSLIFAFFSISAFALSQKDFSLFVDGSFGIKRGEIGEYVFQKDDGKWKKLSELNWDEKWIPCFDFSVQGGFKQFFATLDFSFGVPCESGIMADSDWQNSEDWGMKTNYSESENRLKYDFDFCAKIGFDFQISSEWKIAPTAEFEYATFRFEARNGHGWYADSAHSKDKKNHEWNSDYATEYPSKFLGGIDYERDALLSYVGFSAHFSPKNFSRFLIEADAAISPFSRSISYDRHWDVDYKSGTDYADEVYSFFTRIKAGLRFFYLFSKKIEFFAATDGFFSFTDQGTNYSKSIESSKYKKETVEGGADEWFVLVRFGCRFKIM